jgi:serine/threonine-protein kinase
VKRAASISGAAAALVVSFQSVAAQAQDASNQAAAEALFDQGKVAMAAKKYAEACPKFFESNRLDEGIGTSLWLADCYEKNGQTASAWATFREAAALAVRGSDPREKVARARAQALEPKLSRLSIVVPPAARLPDLRVARDGGEVAAAIWGTPVPTDPGRHTVVVSAPDHRPETLTIDIGAGPGEQTLTVPLLVEAPAPPVVATAPADGAPGPRDAAPASSASGFPAQRIAAVAVGGAGVVTLAVGSYFGLHAMSELSDSNANGNCHSGNLCNGAGVSDRSSAQSAATVSTVLFVVGGVAHGGGVALWFTTPSSASAPKPATALATRALRSVAHRVSPWIDPRTGVGGVVVRSEF